MEYKAGKTDSGWKHIISQALNMSQVQILMLGMDLLMLTD